MNNDLISRQWLMECVNEGWIKFETEKDENRFVHLVRDIAPSAQPEIIRCEDCKHRYSAIVSMSNDGNEGWRHECMKHKKEVTLNWFCANAERRTDERMNAKERQLWYWRKEMESCHRRMRVYKHGTEDYNHWKQRYESAVKTYNELSGMNLEVTDEQSD